MAEPDSGPMAAPFYSDLQKKANEVFTKGYHFGFLKLNLKTKSEAGVDFTSSLISNQESGKVTGSVQSKYALKDKGLTFTEKWNTDNTLGADIELKDAIAQGLKLNLDCNFTPATGGTTGFLKTAFSNETVALNAIIDLNRAGPAIDVAGVVAYQGWHVGVNSMFDTQKNEFGKNNVALGYHTKDFVLHTNVDNGKDFCGSIYQKVTENTECGVSMKWATAADTETLFGIGFKHALDKDTSLHAKLNNKAVLGLGLIQQLRPGITFTLSATLDTLNLSAGGHKVGLNLELEPNATAA